MMDIIIDFFIKVYRAVGLQGLGIGLVLVITTVWISLFLRKKLKPFRRAKSLYEAGHLKRAFSLVLLELEKNPRNKQALLMRAEIHARRGEYRDAEDWYYRIIALKKPGDGIDVFNIKQRLLKPLYHEQKLLDLLNLSKEILHTEKNNPPALYCLGLLYMGQLYYREAKTILDRLISVRPRMHEALFAHAVALLQLNNAAEAVNSLQRAIEIDRETLYDLALSFSYYLLGNYSETKKILTEINPQISRFDTERQYLFALRLGAFCNIKLGIMDDVVEIFRELYDIVGERKKSHVPVEEIKLYNEFGRMQDTKKDRVKTVEGSKSTEGSMAGEYFKLKEFLIEQRREGTLPREDLASSSRFLDVEGLSSRTWAALDLGLAMVKAGMSEKATEFFVELKRSHPEIIGLKRLIDLIPRKEDTGDGGKSTLAERKVNGGSGVAGEELSYYLDAWEKGGMRPYGLMLIAGFSTKKQLSPLVMFRRSGKFSLDL